MSEHPSRYVLLWLTLCWGTSCLDGRALPAHGQVTEPAREKAGDSVTPILLIDDPAFERGFSAWSPRPGRKVRVGQLRPFPDSEPPVWGLAQWSSRFDLSQAERQVIEPRWVRYFDGAKSVSFDFRSSAEPVLTLGVDGTKEYDGKAPKRGAAWPHLLVERKLMAHPSLSLLGSVRFRISYRLIRQVASKPPGWDGRRHTAQFLLYITLRNQNPKSPGLGDYLWFGVSMFDARYRHTPSHKMADLGTEHKGGTGKFIFNPAGNRYTPQSAHDGQWVTIRKDLLPMMREALRDAWAKGFLADSQQLDDYGLGSMNCGWEVTGTWNVAMQIKGLQLEATYHE